MTALLTGTAGNSKFGKEINRKRRRQNTNERRRNERAAARAVGAPVSGG